MNINKIFSNGELRLELEGNLYAQTVGALDELIKNELDDVKSLIVDLEKLNYLSSAGLRALLNAQKIMNERGKMKIINVNDEVMEIFTMTGFSSIFTIE